MKGSFIAALAEAQGADQLLQHRPFEPHGTDGRVLKLFG
jgi:hypothetical protein